jgi:phosphonate transport system permease protein
VTDAALLRAAASAVRRAAERLALVAGVIAALALSLRAVDVDRLPLLFTNSANMADFARGFARPDFGQWRLYVAQMLETVQMALWGTFLAVLFAIPFGLLSAPQHRPRLDRPAGAAADGRAALGQRAGDRHTVRVRRGPGPPPRRARAGAPHHRRAGEAVQRGGRGHRRPTGRGGAGGRRLPHRGDRLGRAPQVAPLWTSFALYRFEANSRSATVLGLIGAGGIGQLLIESLQGFDYGQASAITIVIVAAVTLIDFLSSAVRKRLL